MPQKSSGRPIKPTSKRTDTQRQLALEDNEAERQAAIDRMAEQRKARMSAGELVRMKNRGG
jgi:hypothetical protein